VLGAIPRIALMLLVIWGGMLWLRARVLPTPKERELAIFMKCDYTRLPLIIPPHSALHIIPVNEARMKATNWGFFDAMNDTNTPTQWPNKERMREPNKTHDAGIFGYDCNVSNHGQVNVFDVAIPMTFTFNKDAVRYASVVSPLDVGHDSDFYLFSECPVAVDAILPDEVSLVVAGESTRRHAKLGHPKSNPMGAILSWPLAHTIWVDGDLCK